MKNEEIYIVIVNLKGEKKDYRYFEYEKLFIARKAYYEIAEQYGEENTALYASMRVIQEDEQ